MEGYKPDFFEIDSIGIGLGDRELDRPNFLRACLLNPFENKSLDGLKWDEVAIQESWIDDASSEDLSFLMDQLRNAGAIEVASQQIQMKRNDFYSSDISQAHLIDHRRRGGDQI